MIEKYLQPFSLNEKEIMVYTCIAEYGKISAKDLGKFTKINRSTIYSVAKELISKGLIREDMGGKILYYTPADKEDLQKLLLKEEEQFKQKSISIQELQRLVVQTQQSKTYSVPKVRFVEEDDIEQYLFDASLRWNESILASDSTWWGFQDVSLVGKYEKWIDWYWKISSQTIQLKLFSNDSETELKMKEKLYNERRQIRFMSGHDFTATQWVIGSYIVYIMTQQRPYYLVEIHDSVIAYNTRLLFKNMWEKFQK